VPLSKEGGFFAAQLTTIVTKSTKKKRKKKIKDKVKGNDNENEKR